MSWGEIVLLVMAIPVGLALGLALVWVLLIGGFLFLSMFIEWCEDYWLNSKVRRWFR